MVTYADRVIQLLNLWRFRYPLACRIKREVSEPFFIIGCGRSGNTLLRSMLCAGEQVSIPPESYVWPRIIRLFKAYSHLPWDRLSALIIGEFEAYKEFYTWDINLALAHRKVRSLPVQERSLSSIIDVVYQEYNLQKGDGYVRWGEKTPINTIHIGKVFNVFPKAQFVHIVRDPRDVVCSYVSAGLYDSYKDAAKFWKASVCNALSLSRKIPAEQFLQVRYEDLVREPEPNLSCICSFLGIKYSPAMNEFYKASDKLGDVGTHNHHDNISKPLTTSSIGKYTSILSPDEVLTVEQVVGKEMLKYFKYA